MHNSKGREPGARPAQQPAQTLTPDRRMVDSSVPR
jgi:hypothetical protein